MLSNESNLLSVVLSVQKLSRVPMGQIHEGVKSETINPREISPMIQLTPALTFFKGPREIYCKNKMLL